VTDARRREFDLTDESRPERHRVLMDLIREHERMLYRFLVVLTGDREAALDCVQDVFIRAWEHLQNGRSVNRQWLYKVGRNRAIDELRRRKRERTDLMTLHDLSGPGSTEDMVDLQQAFDALPVHDRAVLYLSVVEGLTGEEVATVLGIGHGAFRMRLLRARERFREQYGGKG
jgi:RNA polymerase sigma-70 factor, ECF subfamily